MIPKDDDEPRILEICETLHMLAHGGLEIRDVGVARAAYLERWLQRRLSAWKTGIVDDGGFRPIYDGLVKLLAETALREWLSCSWHPRWAAASAARDTTTNPKP